MAPAAAPSTRRRFGPREPKRVPMDKPWAKDTLHPSWLARQEKKARMAEAKPATKITFD